MVGLQFLAAKTAAQIGRQGLAHAHRKHARFFKGSAEVGRDVTSGKHQGVVHRLQLGVDQNEALRVERQTRALQPCGSSRLGDPKGFIGIKGATIAGVQATGRDLHHLGMRVHIDIALFQHFVELSANPSVVRGQDGFACGQQDKLQVFTAAPQRFELVAQTVLHGQQQLDPTSATADHRHRHAAAVGGPMPCFVQQGQPALVELRNGLHRNGHALSAFNQVHLWGGANVDGQEVIGHALSVATNDFLVFAVDADHRVVEQSRTHKSAQAPQIDVHFVKAVVA